MSLFSRLITPTQDFQRRRKVAKFYNELRPHLGVLESFGALGMSSDESLNERGRNTKYVRLKHRYRADEVTQWLHVFDRAYFVWRRMRFDVDRRGRPGRIREDREGAYSSNPKVPPGLPINAFNPAWLKAQNPVRVNSELRPVTSPYTFQHDPEFLRYKLSSSLLRSDDAHNTVIDSCGRARCRR